MSKSRSEDISNFSEEADVETYTPLMLAASDNNIPKIFELLGSGADVNAHSLLGSTAAMFAAQRGRKELIELLESRGANLRLKNRADWDVLSYSVSSGNLELVKWLVSWKKVELTDEVINRAILIAAVRNNFNFKMLLYLFQVFGTNGRTTKSILAMADNSFIPIDTKSIDISRLEYARDMCAQQSLLDRNQLHEVDLHVLSEIQEMILSSLRFNTSIRKLRGTYLKNLTKNQVNIFAKFLENNHNLEELVFIHNFINEYDMQLLGRALLANNKLKLKKLKLDSCKIGIQGATILAELIRKNPIEALELGHCELGDEGVFIIMQAINENPRFLLHLDLTYNDIKLKSAAAIAALLTHKETCLESLSVEANHNLEDGIDTIANAAALNNTLVKLCLSNLNFTEDKRVKALAYMIETNTTIKNLKIYNLHCNDEQGVWLANALRTNVALEKVNFSNNMPRPECCFGLSAANALGEALAVNRSLKNLTLEGQITLGLGMQAIAAGLVNNHTLTHLDLVGVKMTDEGFNLLLEAINQGRAVSNLAVDEKVGNGIIDTLETNLKRSEFPIISLSIPNNIIDTEGRTKIMAALRYNKKIAFLGIGNHFFGRQDDSVVAAKLVETLRYYNCSLTSVSGLVKNENQDEINNFLDRNKKISNNNLPIVELKALFDQIKTDRSKATPPLPNSPYSLRFSLSFFCLALNNSTVKEDVVRTIHEDEKPRLVNGFLDY